MANSEIRVGNVSSINYEKGMARITYKDKDDTVTMEFPMMNYNDEYRMPKPGQDIVVAHLSNGSSRGVILGTIWNNKNIPTEAGKEIYRKDFSREKDAAYIRYDDNKGEYLVKAANVHINGVNELRLDGPEVELAANISILIQTENMKINAEQLKAVMTDTFIELAEKLEVKTGTEIKLSAEEKTEITAGTDIVFKAENDLILQDSKYTVTLWEIMEGLGAEEE